VQISLGFRLRESGVSTAGQAGKSRAKFEEASNAVETDQRMRAAAAMALKGQMPAREPELPEGKLAFDGALDFR
jgi:hypothetical protein